ncbi:hypothetical protein BDZ94DRAFT_1266212 [Collybia nuda]|uniref:Uncharacterized protein n=1 Tax=Collybia nuda TaxID=64659 RepID=A0A9P5Y170_9AGAR|nr:hypothetical protein BDZ94DRAFT_1266212 [Collybia nuda]
MLRCPELKKLSKAPVFSSVNFLKQTPGSAVPLIHPNLGHVERIDPSHPAVGRRRNAFPKFNHEACWVKAFPMALLGEPVFTWPEPHYRIIDTWEDRIDRARHAQDLAGYKAKDLPEISQMILNNERPNSVPMSLLVATSKKRTSSKKVIRSKISRRLKTALTLIVARGADVDEVNGKKTIVFNQDEAKRADDWILRGWSYVFFPTIEIYRMPYHEMIPLFRLALRDIRDHGRKLEATWEDEIPPHTIRENKLPWESPLSAWGFGDDQKDPRASRPRHSAFDVVREVLEGFKPDNFTLSGSRHHNRYRQGVRGEFKSNSPESIQPQLSSHWIAKEVFRPDGLSLVRPRPGPHPEDREPGKKEFNSNTPSSNQAWSDTEQEESESSNFGPIRPGLENWKSDSEQFTPNGAGLALPRIGNRRAIRGVIGSDDFSWSQPQPDERPDRSSQTSVPGNVEHGNHLSNTSRPQTSDWRGRYSGTSANTRYVYSGKPREPTTQPEERRESEPQTSVEKPHETSRIASDSRASSSAIKFFKRQKDPTPTRKWGLRDENDTIHETLEVLKHLHPTRKPFTYNGNDALLPGTKRSYVNRPPLNKSALANSRTGKTLQKSNSDVRKNDPPRNPVQDLGKGEDLKAQTQDALDNRPSKPNFIFRPLPRSKR